jgi:hypothetical protein
MGREILAGSGFWRRLVFTLLGALAAVLLAGCGTAGGSSSPSPPPASSPTVSVSVSPSTASLYFGQQQQFTANVTGTSNTAVNWAVNGVAGGDTALGEISAQGVYTAPAVLPSITTITIAATSQADSTASATATVTLRSDVQVQISPPSATAAIGATQHFSAQVSGSGSPNTSVNWSLTGSACPANCGTLAVSGNTATYTAPATMPATPGVQIVATSVADPSKSATADVTITAACATPISVSPATASLATGGQESFTAQVCFSTNQKVTWSISGSGCNGTSCGTVSSTGASTATYTAPASLPPANPVTLTATSAADVSQTASASITITAACATPITVSPSAATVSLGQQQSFTASVCFSTNQSVTWSISGSGCNGTNCGTVSSTGAGTATYTAPTSLPPSNPITVVATSLADSSKEGTASIAVVSAISVTLNTISAEVALNQRVTLSVGVQATSNQAVTWSVEGVTNGNTTLGEICASGSSPCSPPTGPTTSAVDYLAPAAVPNPAGVYVTATSAADTSQSATAEMTVLPHLAISLSPVNSVVAPVGTVEFAATITGAANSAVAWQISCPGSACGTITTSGVYTAPATAPSPNQITITATSQADPTQSATAAVALTSAVALSNLSPASVTAGAASGFPLAVTGYDFTPTSPGPGTTLLVNGTARTTNCSSTTACTVTLSAADVASAGTVGIEAKNPDGTQSNSLPLIVVPAGGPAAVLSLSPSAPVAGAADVTAVQPTTDGSASAPMTVVFLGLVDTSTNTCNVTESPVELGRLSSGTASYTICLGGNGLDPSFTYAIVGSQSSDVTVSNPRWFDGSLVAITLTISTAAGPGPRTLIITDPNDDRAAASGAIDVE